MGLIITNGPGTISAQGSKGAVSADGPEVPERVQINKAVPSVSLRIPVLPTAVTVTRRLSS